MRPHVVHWLEQFMRADVAELVAPTWFTCIGLAGLVTLVLMLVLARRRGVASGTVASAVLWCYVAAVTAGIVVPMAIDSVEHLVTTGHFHLRWSGMTSFWGYLAGGTAVVLVCRRDGMPLGKFADLSVIPLGIALVCARIGCFMAGCDYGKVSSLPWAVRFPAGSPAWRDHLHAGLIPAGRTASLPVHPTELYEALIGVAIVGIAIVLGRRPRKEGHMFLIAAATYAVGRLFVETLRGDAGRGIYAGLSSGQIFSLLVLAAIALRFIVGRRRMLTTTGTAIASAALVFAVAGVGEAEAQPAPQHVPFGPPAPPPQPDSDPFGPPPAQPQVAPPEDTPPPPPEQPPEPPSFDPAPFLAPARPPVERPHFLVGALFGFAAPLNRRSDQIPTATGASVSAGYTPGWFGVWLDFDRYSNGEASHTTVLASVSFARRVTRQLTLGARAGIGITQVNFDDPAFPDVAGKTVRLEATAEYAFTRNWGLWIRPLTIDTLSASELGGPITTYQFRIGVDYRFGFHRTRPASPPPPAPPPPPPYPSLDPEPPPPETASAEQP